MNSNKVVPNLRSQSAFSRLRFETYLHETAAGDPSAASPLLFLLLLLLRRRRPSLSFKRLPPLPSSPAYCRHCLAHGFFLRHPQGCVGPGQQGLAHALLQVTNAAPHNSKKNSNSFVTRAAATSSYSAPLMSSSSWPAPTGCVLCNFPHVFAVLPATSITRRPRRLTLRRRCGP